MLKIIRLSFLILLFSAIMFPLSTYASDNGSGSSQKTSIFSQFISIFTGKNGNNDNTNQNSNNNNNNYNDKDWDWDDINRNDIDYKESYDIWKKWYSY